MYSIGCLMIHLLCLLGNVKNKRLKTRKKYGGFEVATGSLTLAPCILLYINQNHSMGRKTKWLLKHFKYTQCTAAAAALISVRKCGVSAKLNLRVKVWRVTHFDVLPGKVGDLWSKAARGVHWADRSLVPLDDVEFCAHPVIILRKEEKAERWIEWLVKHSSISSHIVIHLQSHAMQRELHDRCINGRGPFTCRTWQEYQ